MKTIKTILIIILAGLITACSNTETVAPIADNWTPVTIDGQFVFNTFKQVGLWGNEKETVRWQKDNVYYWLDPEGLGASSIEALTDSIFMQVNEQSKSTKFIKVGNQTTADIILYSGKWSEFSQKYGVSASLTTGDGFSVVGYAFNWYVSKTTEINKTRIWLADYYDTYTRRLGMRHEICHAIGMNHSYVTEKSVMTTTINKNYDTRFFTEVDKTYIKILYDPRVRAGMTFQDIMPVFKDYLK